MSFINDAPSIDFENGKEIGYKQAKKESQELIGKIMELHAPEQIFDDWYCSHCLEDFDHGTDQATYPCETVKIIITKVAAQAWQDGHDTALLHGQSENPYFKTKEKPE